MSDEPPRLPGEEWRPVVGWEGLYEVSDMGRLRSLDRTLVSPAGNERTYKGRLIAQHAQSYGYAQAGMSAHGRHTNRAVHRIVMDAFVGPPPEPGMVVHHKNAIRNDNRLCNLEYVTQQRNMQFSVPYRKPRQTKADEATYVPDGTVHVEVIFHPWTPESARAYKRALEEHM